MPSLEAKPFIYSYETRLGTEGDKGELNLKEGEQWKSRRLLHRQLWTLHIQCLDAASYCNNFCIKIFVVVGVGMKN